MRLLVHAIVRSEDTLRLEQLPEPEGAALGFVSEGMLAAVCSPAPATDAKPDVGELLAYARGIHELFLRVTVLPMRYGCCLDNRQDLCQWLRRNGPDLQACLQQVDGCAEMGVRILPVESPAGALPVDLPQANGDVANAEQASASPGVNYLLARKNRYARKDEKKDAFHQTTRHIQAALQNLFVKSVAQQHGAKPGGYWSLYFLVRRELHDHFRAAFGELEGSVPEKLLLTGPWPPYNFVDWKSPGLSS